MKIAFFETKEEDKQFFKSKLSDQDLFFFKGTINEELDAVAEYDVISVFVHSNVDEAIVAKLPNLKYIQTRSTGYDHLHCNVMYKRGLILSNVSGYAGPAVAEFAFSLLLNATRNTDVAMQRTKEGDFHYEDLKGIELFGKTIGVLGLGTIGTQMVKIAHGFGMKTLVYSRTHKAVVDQLGVEFVTLEELLAQSDIIMFALPLTPNTQNILNSENSELLKNEAIIINAARAGLIEDKLYRTLKNKIYADVLDEISLISQDNIAYTPHMAYYTKEALERILEISLKNIESFLEGKVLPNCLLPECQKNYR